MRILLTGTPGTGKTILARWLAKKLGYPLLSIRSFVLHGRFYKRKGREKEVDIQKLQRALLPHIRKHPHLIIEGHLAADMKLPADYAVVLRTPPPLLRRRLIRRRYPKKKLEENLMAEMLDYCTQQAKRNYSCPVVELETAGNLAKTGNRLLRAIKLKRKKLDSVDYDRYLRRELKLK